MRHLHFGLLKVIKFEEAQLLMASMSCCRKVQLLLDDTAECRPHTLSAYFLQLRQYPICHQQIYILGTAVAPVQNLVEHRKMHGKPGNVHRLMETALNSQVKWLQLTTSLNHFLLHVCTSILLYLVFIRVDYYRAEYQSHAWLLQGQTAIEVYKVCVHVTTIMSMGVAKC